MIPCERAREERVNDQLVLYTPGSEWISLNWGFAELHISHERRIAGREGAQDSKDDQQSVPENPVPTSGRMNVEMHSFRTHKRGLEHV